MPAEDGIRSLVTRLIQRADRLPPQPLPASRDIRPLDTAPALIFAARKYRNCLSDYVPRALAGIVAFAEYQDRLILEFQPVSNGAWLLVSVNAKGNGFVHADDNAKVRAYCAQFGIHHTIDGADLPAWWDSVARFGRGWSWSPG